MNRAGWLLIALWSITAGLASQAYGQWRFGDTTPIVDTRTYHWQADALADGQLRAPVPDAIVDGTEPQFGVIVQDGHAIFKYLPGTAALAAVSQATTGTHRAGLALAVAALVSGVAALTLAVGRSPRAAEAAAVAMGTAPITLSVGSLLLSYVPAVALLVWGAALALRRSERLGSPIAAGACFGIALLFRQLGPALWFLAIAAVLLRRDGWRAPAALTLGAFPGAVACIAIAVHVTGSLRLPFSVVGPDDRFGFGLRRVGRYDELVDFTVGRSFDATTETLGHLGVWGPLSLAGVALAIGGLVTLDRTSRGILAVLAGAIPLVLLAHWSVYNAVRFEAVELIGSFYYLPTAAIVAVLAGVGAERALGSSRPAVFTGFAVLIVMSGYALARAQTDISNMQSATAGPRDQAWDTFVATATSIADRANGSPAVLADLTFISDRKTVDRAEDDVAGLRDQPVVLWENAEAAWAALDTCSGCAVLLTSELVTVNDRFESFPGAVPQQRSSADPSAVISLNTLGRPADHWTVSVLLDGVEQQSVAISASDLVGEPLSLQLQLTADGESLTVEINQEILDAELPGRPVALTVRAELSFADRIVGVGEARTIVAHDASQGVRWAEPLRAFAGDAPVRLGPVELFLSLAP